jgi:ribosomal protein S18 acetylase RimI-like enzyme
MHIVPLSENRHLLASAATAAARAFTYDTLFLWLRPHGEGASLTASDPGEPAPCPSESLQASQWFYYLRQHFLFNLRRSVVTPCQITLVAVSDTSDSFWSGEEEVLGYAMWWREFPERIVSAEEQRQREEVWGGETFWKKGERWCINKEEDYVKKLGLDSYNDQKHLDLFQAVWSDFHPVTQEILMKLGRGGTDNGQHGTYEAKGLGSGDGYVWLQFIGIDPSFQRRGLGGKLMQWGMDRARIERVPAGLVASPQGVGLYQKWGFEDVGKRIKYGEIEDLFMVAWVPDEDIQ